MFTSKQTDKQMVLSVRHYLQSPLSGAMKKRRTDNKALPTHSQGCRSGQYRKIASRKANLYTSEFRERMATLFKSGQATEAQWAELVEAVLSAQERDLGSVAAINQGVGFGIGVGA